jgi:cytochrome b561
MTMPASSRQFAPVSRFLHWTMAAMVLTMLCIGVAMVASLADYRVLVSIHRPLGIAILILVVIRFLNRLLNPPPSLPATMSRAERRAALATEYAMYGLMLALPLVGWGMLSAARYPVQMFGGWRLPFILPQDPLLYAALRKTHTILAYLFIVAFLGHLGGVLYHTLVLRDGLLMRMTPWNRRPSARAPEAVGTAMAAKQ